MCPSSIDPDVSRPAPANDEALKAILDRHRIWLDTDGLEGGRAELAGACLRGMSFWRADLRNADLEGADLRRANLDHAGLSGASLKDACLVGASLWQADLSDADLAAADLRDAKLDHAILRSTVMRGTDLGGASFWGAHLEGADLSDAVGLVPSQLEPTSRDARTRLPALSCSGTTAPAPAQEVSGTSETLKEPPDGIEDDPVVLDERRGMAARKATEVRRHLAEVEAQQTALRQRQAELERFLFAAPAASWEEAADKARYLIMLFADTSLGRDPRRRRIIADVLEDFRRLSGEQTQPGIQGDELRPPKETVP